MILQLTTEQHIGFVGLNQLELFKLLVFLPIGISLAGFLSIVSVVELVSTSRPFFTCYLF